MKFPPILLALSLLLLLAHGCASTLPKHGPAAPGFYRMDADMETGGFSRKSLVYIPESRESAEPRPLLIVLHGAFSNALEIAERTGFNDLADREEFFVLYPEGIGILGWLQHWNAGHCCGKAEKDGVDDVGFLDAAIEKTIRRFPVDPKRIFLVGHSNGGMLAHRYAALRPGKLAGMAAVSAAINSKTDDLDTFPALPNPKSPLPVCIIHGVGDESIPYAGGATPGKHEGREFSSAADAAGYWAAANGCLNGPAEEREYGGRVKRSAWKGCSGGAPVVLFSIEKWMHAWPGRDLISTLDTEGEPFDFDAAETLWKFFITP